MAVRERCDRFRQGRGIELPAQSEAADVVLRARRPSALAFEEHAELEPRGWVGILDLVWHPLAVSGRDEGEGRERGELHARSTPCRAGELGEGLIAEEILDFQLEVPPGGERADPDAPDRVPSQGKEV